MRRYEQVYILRPTLSEEEINRVVDSVGQLISDDGGSIIFLNRWGMRKLAYPIKKENQGYYVLCDFAANPGIVSEIERRFRIDDTVLKYLTVKITDQITAAEIEAARSDAEARATVPERDSEAEKAAKPGPEKAAESTSATKTDSPREQSTAAPQTDESGSAANADRQDTAGGPAERETEDASPAAAAAVDEKEAG